jgi:hypothetical protein
MLKSMNFREKLLVASLFFFGRYCSSCFVIVTENNTDVSKRITPSVKYLQCPIAEDISEFNRI